MVKGFGDGFFDEAFFQADAQFAGGDLDEVLGFEGGEALECVLEESLFGGRSALLSERGVDFGDLLKAKRRPHGMVAQDFFGACAEIAMAAEDRSDLGGIFFCKVGDRAKENREADREYALLAARENAAAKVKRGDKDATAPKRDLKLEALADVLRGKLMVQIHCYRADEFLTEIAMAKEFGYHIRAFHHALEAYKVPEKLAAENIGIATFADWWGYKQEAWDAIPWNAVMAMRKGVRVAIKSDSNDFARRLNQEAAKTMRYGGATEEEALKMITLNAAWIVGVDDKVGSIEVGKDADLVIWDGYPLSSSAVPNKVLIDGDVYFDRALPGYGMPHYSEGQ